MDIIMIFINVNYVIDVISSKIHGVILYQLVLFFLSLNILQDSSFSNQITFIFHIQGVFNLPGRGFRQRITLTSSVPMMLNDVIVHESLYQVN